MGYSGDVREVECGFVTMLLQENQNHVLKGVDRLACVSFCLLSLGSPRARIKLVACKMFGSEAGLVSTLIPSPISCLAFSTSSKVLYTHHLEKPIQPRHRWEYNLGHFKTDLTSRL